MQPEKAAPAMAAALSRAPHTGKVKQLLGVGLGLTRQRRQLRGTSS